MIHYPPMNQGTVPMKALLVLGCAVAFCSSVFFGNVVIAQDTCGDGVCSALERESGRCKKDCSKFRGWCGNSRCELNENCRTCSIDCGDCGGDIERVAAISCGDNVCSPGEGCGSCPEDCGACPGTWLGKAQYAIRRAMRLVQLYLREGVTFVGEFTNLNEAVEYVQQQRGHMKQGAILRSEAANDLLTFLETHEALEREFGGMDKRILAYVAGQGESAGVTNALPTIRLQRKVEQAIQAEDTAMADAVDQILTSDVVRDALAEQGTLTEVQQAVRSKDIQTLTDALPRPRRSLNQLTNSLRTYEGAFSSGGEEAAHLDGFVAFAAGEEEETAKSAFLDSVNLLMDMRARAQDPEAAAITLDENIEYLQSRKALLSGVIGKSENELNRDINDLSAAGDKKTSKSIISAVNLARFIRSSENFQRAETLYWGAARRMSYGFLGLFTMRDPTARATDFTFNKLTAEQLRGLKSKNLEDKKESLKSVFREHGKESTSIISTLADEDRRVFEDRFATLILDMNNAEDVQDLQEVLTTWYTLMTNLQEAYKGRRNLLYRLTFSVKSYLGSP